MRKLLLFTAMVVAATVLPASASALHEVNDKTVGGGWFAIDNPDIRVVKVREGLTLYCTSGIPGNSLEVTWGRGNYFHLREMETDPVCNQNVPNADDGGSHKGTGTGTCNGQPAHISWTIAADTFTAETGFIGDAASFTIAGTDPNCTLETTVSALGGGNFTFIDNPDI